MTKTIGNMIGLGSVGLNKKKKESSWYFLSKNEDSVSALSLHVCLDNIHSKLVRMKDGSRSRYDLFLIPERIVDVIVRNKIPGTIFFQENPGGILEEF